MRGTLHKLLRRAWRRFTVRSFGVSFQLLHTRETSQRVTVFSGELSLKREKRGGGAGDPESSAHTGIHPNGAGLECSFNGPFVSLCETPNPAPEGPSWQDIWLPDSCGLG